MIDRRFCYRNECQVSEKERISIETDGCSSRRSRSRRATKHGTQRRMQFDFTGDFVVKKLGSKDKTKSEEIPGDILFLILAVRFFSQLNILLLSLFSFLLLLILVLLLFNWISTFSMCGNGDVNVIAAWKRTTVSEWLKNTHLHRLSLTFVSRTERQWNTFEVKMVWQE